MALIDFSFYSECLGMVSEAKVIIPQPTMGQIGMKGKGRPDGCPVLYLLHGLSDDHSIWLRRTSIERYAANYGIAVVMMNGHRSYYANQANGLMYWDFISEELPAIIKGFFKFSTERSDTFVAGLSMGGHGAAKLALNKPETFAAAGCFSSAVSPEYLAELMPARKFEFEAIFGGLDKVKGSVNDLYASAERLKKSGVTPPDFFMACGSQDDLLCESHKLRDHLLSLGIPVTYHEEAGNHEWGFWDKQIQNFLAWLKETGHLK